MSTCELIRRAGFGPLLCALLLSLVVVVLRLLALPVALTLVALDEAAVLVARLLPYTDATPPRGG